MFPDLNKLAGSGHSFLLDRKGDWAGNAVSRKSFFFLLSGGDTALLISPPSGVIRYLTLCDTRSAPLTKSSEFPRNSVMEPSFKIHAVVTAL